MITEHKHKNISWIDIENPTQEEAREIAEKYRLDPMVAGDLLSPTVSPKADYYDSYIYLVLHFPIAHSLKEGEEEYKKVEEIDFIIGKDFVITTRYTNVNALSEFSKILEVQTVLNKDETSADHAGYVFFYMMRHLYKSSLHNLENIRDLMSDIERNIFAGNERQMVMEISKINRLLLNYQVPISQHKEILYSFQIAGQKFFSQNFTYHLKNILNEYQKVEIAITDEKEYLNELRDTNNSLLSTKQNEIMKVLTVTTFIMLPLSLVAAIFSMNTISTPLIGSNSDFLKIIAIMIVLSGSFFLYFRHKKWL